MLYIHKHYLSIKEIKMKRDNHKDLLRVIKWKADSNGDGFSNDELLIRTFQTPLSGLFHIRKSCQLSLRSQCWSLLGHFLIQHCNHWNSFERFKSNSFSTYKTQHSKSLLIIKNKRANESKEKVDTLKLHCVPSTQNLNTFHFRFLGGIWEAWSRFLMGW